MADIKISKEIKEQVINIVEEFNYKNRKKHFKYIPRFRGKYLYLDREDYGENTDKICRLEYTGEMDNWEFSIYKFSDEAYDDDEIFFPGSELVDGTIIGAMKASLKAYPV